MVGTPAGINWLVSTIWDGPLKVPSLPRTNPIYIRRHLRKLDPLRGKHANEIVHQLGIPSTSSALANGTVLLQWQAVASLSGAVHVALVFDAATGTCQGVQHLHSG
jgi:hypothetical protein